MVASCLQKIELWYPSFGFQAIDCDHATAASQWRIVEDQLLDPFGLRVLEAGLPAFQLPMYSVCDALPKKDCSTCLFKESIPAIPGISKHPLPTRSRFLRATVRSTSSALWLHHAHPFVAATEKKQSHAEKQRVSKICYVQYSDCVQDLDSRMLIGSGATSLSATHVRKMWRTEGDLFGMFV